MTKTEGNILAFCLAPLPIIGLFTMNMPLLIGGLIANLAMLVYALREPEREAKAERLEAERLEREAENAYYNEGEPIMDDDEYDELNRETETERIGAPVIGGTTHATRMLSLRNAIDEEELRDFFNRINATVGAASFIIEPKIDGMAANATYSNYELVSVTTRGDGSEGKDITDKVLHLFRDKIKLESAEIRGELYLSKANLTALNKGRVSMGQKPFQTCQSATTATVMKGNSQLCKARKVAFVAYDMGTGKEIAGTQSYLCEVMLKKMGFKILPNSKVRTFDGMMRASKRMCAECKLPCDGAVVKLNDIDGQVEMGVTKTAPQHAIAWKGCKE